ncbi:16S rRNA (uracil(1498)-N(3))-methyltransferase [Mycetocola zhadangensis]|uniref:Ribosomal RNA small subunit methyltransferase E n=1 Tax=Mycetocola zhadangensis TaxID=1164595 RepID=A0A3L7J6C9_9MICO|nr:16S rRNA (uracil(1498)-N(3))-methyltransferase [Mycetocola zhadangensis]RLQ85999.1 16S rRNA (uracil(1498)-N(3))-methyltransferase [Mycetocola zhadangensis]GGE87507.1 ribosomal RNA small subunit methyltransferase E [Mycetocola zhadangensis]
MANLYLNETLTETRPGELIELSGPEAKHVTTVSRAKVGDDLLVGNGRGLFVWGIIETIEAGRVGIRVSAVRNDEPVTPGLVLVQALAKGDRDELAIQAATELGVSRIIPWAASRSVSRWEGQKKEKGRARWETIVREASKQSIRSFVPPVEPIVSTAELATLAAESRVLLLEPTATDRLSDFAPVDGDKSSSDILLVVGPEGGISPAEIASLTAAGARAVRLGDTVLRTSTAGPAALAVLNLALGRW